MGRMKKEDKSQQYSDEEPDNLEPRPGVGGQRSEDGGVDEEGREICRNRRRQFLYLWGKRVRLELDMSGWVGEWVVGPEPMLRLVLGWGTNARPQSI
jgi:hypothetical protein